MTAEREATTEEPSAGRGGRLGAIVRAFGKLGLISFGGPVAHLGYFHNEFVRRRRWIDDDEYADLVALCQFLPGPASSQVVFALGMRRAGVIGGLLASACFTLPSAALLIAFAYGVGAMGDLSTAGWLHGLKLAAVAVVAQAVWGMGCRLCPDALRAGFAIIAAALVLVVPGALAQIAAIVAGAAFGWIVYRHAAGTQRRAGFDRRSKSDRAGEEESRAALDTGTALHAGYSLRAGVWTLVLFAALLVVLPILARVTSNPSLRVFDAFYRSGSLVFGGGHVVLPLLHAEVVPPGWVSDDQFLAGYGAAQAVPGPLFTFAGYLGATMMPGRWAWANGLWCLLGIFLPAWLLIGGALPFWHGLRSRTWAQAGLKGANAAVVGILLAALYHPVFTSAVHTPSDVAAALLAFAALQVWKAPPWTVVLALAAVGQWAL